MKYLHAVLTIIAVCLIMITFAVTGIIPSANAEDKNPRTVSVPLNPDGSINVKFAPGTISDVNIKEVGGNSNYGKIDVNVAAVDGSSFSGSLPVKIAN